LLHSIGVKDIARVANTCENFSREYVILSDSDKPAKEKKKIFNGCGMWFCYDEINGIDAITTEDFMSNALLNKAIKNIFKINGISNLVTIGDIDVGKIAYIEKEIDKLNITSITLKELMNQIKEYTCLNATAADLDDRYLKVCEFIIKSIIA